MTKRDSTTIFLLWTNAQKTIIAGDVFAEQRNAPNGIVWEMSSNTAVLSPFLPRAMAWFRINDLLVAGLIERDGDTVYYTEHGIDYIRLMKV